MSRWGGLTIGVAGVLALWTAGGPTVLGADDGEGDRRVRVVRRGAGAFLGVSLAEVDADVVARLRLSDERGALVRSVEPDSPAASAGLKTDDVIVGYQGEPVRSAAQLSRLVRETPPGRKVTIEVRRNGASQTLTATLREGRRAFGMGDFDFDFPMPAIDVRPPRPPRAPRPPDGEPRDFDFRELLGSRRGRLGLSYQELTDQLAGYFKVGGGLLVVSVREGSPAADAGVKAGDVIVKANGKAVRSSEDLRDELDRAEPGSEVTLGLQREGHPLEVKAKLREESRERIRRRDMTL